MKTAPYTKYRKMIAKPLGHLARYVAFHPDSHNGGTANGIVFPGTPRAERIAKAFQALDAACAALEALTKEDIEALENF